MANTVRTMAQIMALLADNTTGAISPQDLRDAVESLRPDYAQIKINSPAPSPVTVSGTFVKAAGTTTIVASPAARNFTMPSDNRLRYDGTAKRLVLVSYDVSVNLNGFQDQEIRVRIAKNGTTLAEGASHLATQVAVNSCIVPTSGRALIEMVTNDYVEVWVTNQDSTSDPQLDTLNLTCVALAIES